MNAPDFLPRLMDEAPDAVLLTDRAARILYVNQACEVLTGYSRQELLGATPALLGSGRQSAEFYARMWTVLLSGKPFSGMLENRHRNGQIFKQEMTIHPLRDDRGQISHFLSIGREVTHRIAEVERLTWAATHDPLTDLPNRSLFLDRLEQAVGYAQRNDEAFMVALLDLDGFKAVNDTCGHVAGDTLLCSVAQRLGQSMRQTDTIARLGGDEFGLLLMGGGDPAAAVQVLAKIVETVAQPVAYATGPLRVTASIGACRWHHGVSDGQTLLNLADRAMYRTKISRGNGFHLHDWSDDLPSGFCTTQVGAQTPRSQAYPIASRP